MANEKLISFDLMADFGFFKKPDYNDGLLLSYNMLHKPAFLGILGAIAGMEGYQRTGQLPEYYQKFKDLLISIEPIGHDKGNFGKSSVKYTNTVGYANLDGNLLVEETILVRPAYRCYLLLDIMEPDHENLYKHISAGEAEYIPYLGKNEYQAWFDGYTEYKYSRYTPSAEFKIATLFIKEGSIRGKKVIPNFSFTAKSMINQSSFCYFERLPIGLSDEFLQYELNNFAYTDWVLKPDAAIENLYEITDNSNIKKIIQLF